MRSEKLAYITAAGVGAFFAAREGALQHIPDGTIPQTIAYGTGILGGELHRRHREFDLPGKQEGIKLGLTVGGLIGMRYGVEPEVLVNFAAGTGVTAVAFGASEKVYDLYEGFKGKGKRGKKKKEQQ